MVRWTLQAVVLVLLAAFMFGGCVPTKEELEAAQQQTQQTLADTERLIEEAQKERDAALERADTQYLKTLDERIVLLTKQKDVLVQVNDGIQSAINNYDDPTGLLNDLVPLVPEPYKGPAVVVVGAAALVWRLYKSRQALRSLATSTVKAAAQDPVLAERIAVAAPLLEKIQTPTAARAVDAAQGRRTLSPI